MRVGKIEVNGTEYPLCLSTSLICELEEETGLPHGEAIDKIISGGKVSELFGLMARMIAAGCRYKKLIGEEAPDPISKQDLADLIGLDDYPTVFGQLYASVTGGATPEVTVEPDSKNAETSPRD